MEKGKELLYLHFAEKGTVKVPEKFTKAVEKSPDASFAGNTASGAAEQFDFWCSASPDLVYWGESRLVLGAESIPFADAKIGPAAPPVKTAKGWLTTFHAVKYADYDLEAWHLNWRKIYYAGLMLLDLDDPAKVIGIYNKPLLVPERPYEKNGFRGDVIFPGGMILEESGKVKIYYGAADTVECLATAEIGELLDLVTGATV